MKTHLNLITFMVAVLLGWQISSSVTQGSRMSTISMRTALMQSDIQEIKRNTKRD